MALYNRNTVTFYLYSRLFWYFNPLTISLKQIQDKNHRRNRYLFPHNATIQHPCLFPSSDALHMIRNCVPAYHVTIVMMIHSQSVDLFTFRWVVCYRIEYQMGLSALCDRVDQNPRHWPRLPNSVPGSLQTRGDIGIPERSGSACARVSSDTFGIYRTSHHSSVYRTMFGRLVRATTCSAVYAI